MNPLHDPARRVLVVVADEGLRRSLTSSLEAGGCRVLASGDETRVVAQVEGFSPDLVLLGESFPSCVGRQLALSLRARGASFAIPVVGLIDASAGLISVPQVMRWLSVGAVDVWQVPLTRDAGARTAALLAECETTQVQTLALQARLLAFARRVLLSGTIVVYGDTPFEGRATFFDGVLVEATLGTLHEERALAQMLELDLAQVDWFDGQVQTRQLVMPAITGGRPIRVLVVEAAPARAVVTQQALAHAGYQIEVANDGASGLRAALESPFDVVVADLQLPVLDGWGLLRAVRADVVARESAVVVRSGEVELVDALEAARAGARAYLRETGQPDELLEVVARLARPRSLAWQRLSDVPRVSVEVELRAVGAVWLLRTLGELDCRGRLTASDDLTRVEVRVSRGQLVDAVAQQGSRRVQGVGALEVLLACDGAARFEPQPLEVAAEAPWVFDAVNAAVSATAAVLDQRLRRATSRPQTLVVNAELARLFAALATRRQLEVVQALQHGVGSFDELVRALGANSAEVQGALHELVRRGVLTEP